jgi:Sec-independent protein translocase protein TatA
MNVVAEMLLTQPAPVAIWATLVLLSLPATLLLGSPEKLREPGRFLVESVAMLRRFQDRRTDRDQQRAEAVHRLRYADELTEAADRADRAAARWHEHWEGTVQQADTAFRAWQEADRQVTRDRAAAAFLMPLGRTPAEYADRERFLDRLVGDAVDRGDLPPAALAAALDGRDGWNSWLHPADQERALHRAIAEYRHQIHREAVAAEQAAWHDTQLALAARNSLRQEARSAVAQAELVRHLAPAPVRRTVAARRPMLAPATSGI